MKSRRKAREAILQALYQCDTLDDWSDTGIDLYFFVYHTSQTGEFALDEEHCQFAREICCGVAAHREGLDRLIEEASAHWTIPRMARVDRNILRASVYEMRERQEIPVNVSINEAIEIAKRYGAPETPTFVNGVLDKVAAMLRAHEHAESIVVNE